MGIWDWIYSTTEAVKRNAPTVLTPVTEACKTSYGYGSSAAGKAVNAVRSSPEMVSKYMPDQETRSLIGVFSCKLAQNSAKYAATQFIPGGKAVAEIVEQTVRDVKSENKSESETEVVKRIVDSSGGSSKNPVAGVGLHGGGTVQLGSNTANQSPEDVLRIFMMKKFMGNRFTDELFPDIKKLKKNQSEIKD